MNELRGIVRGGAVPTPFGPVVADGHAEAATVQVVIRPEGLKLGPVDGVPAASQGAPACVARVMAARLLGRSSWIHLDIGGPAAPGGDMTPAHFHARVPGSFLPGEGTMLAVHLDPSQAFVFGLGESG